jgi:hypothetical protein
MESDQEEAPVNELPRSPPINIFTLRLWHEPLSTERGEWRGEVKNIATGEVRYFRRWEEIALLVPEMLCDRP